MVCKNKSGQVLIEMVFMLLLFAALLNSFEKINATKKLKSEKHKISRNYKNDYKSEGNK